MLKVFTPAEARTAAEERQHQDATRAKTLADLTDEIVQSKNEAERDFKETMRKQSAEAEAWFTENTRKKNGLLREIEDLEARRKKALIPLLIKAEDIHSTEEALQARKLELDSRESQLEEDSRTLMRRLDEVSDKKQDLETREARLKRMELGAETQKNQVAQDAKRLSLQMAEFEQRMEEKETDFAYRQSELDARSNLFSEKENLLAERENEIEAAKRLLADQRNLLAKGFEELKRLKEQHDNRRLST